VPALPTQALRERTDRPPGAEQPEARPEASPAAKPEKAIRCQACGFVVTSTRHRIVVQGNHEHRFMNPGGFLYHIGCFSEAVGCLTVGPASGEYPWFPGLLWRLALCGGCRAHLGWNFRGDKDAGFFGLILDRLREADDG